MKKINVMLKNITFSIALLISIMTWGQGIMYVHTATSENISFAATRLDHPLLNGNPNAIILIAHNWNGMGAPGVYNNHVSGVWYRESDSRWYIFNEDYTEHVVGAKYNVFIGDLDKGFIHETKAENTIDHATIIPSYRDEYLFFTNLYDGLYNNKRYSWDYFNNTRYLYTPSFDNIELGIKFIIYDPDTSVENTYTHISTNSNISGNWTIIDHPQLNNNPNATFVFCHFYGIEGPSTQVNINKNLGVWYDGSKWAIYSENPETFPSGLAFDLLIADNEMSTTEPIKVESAKVYPNPVVDVLNIETKSKIEKVKIVNMAGQVVGEFQNQKSVDMSNLPSGLYIIYISTPDNLISKKVIKN